MGLSVHPTIRCRESASPTGPTPFRRNGETNSAAPWRASAAHATRKPTTTAATPLHAMPPTPSVEPLVPMVESSDGSAMASQWWPGERNVAQATAATTTGTDKLTIVLAARTHDENGFPRVPLLARSLTKFLAYEAVLEMLVVCPDPDVGTFQRLDALRAMRWPLRVVPDSALLSLSEHNFERVTPAEEWAVGGGRGANYRMQMLTKISVASLVRSDFYLVLDCDVLATRRTQLTDLVRGGKALYAAKPFEYERHRRTWWTACPV